MNQIYEVCGYIPYGKTNITFALPIFRSKHRGGKFIQIPDASSTKVHDFDRVDEPGQLINFSRENRLFKAGMDLQYLLVVEGDVYFGTISSLKNAFQALVQRTDMPKAVAMQIAELIGDSNSLERNLSAYLAELSKESSILDERFVENSVVRNHVWSKLISHCDNKDYRDLHTILKRVLLNVIVKEGYIDLEPSLKEHIAANFNINVQDLIRDVNQSFIGSDRLLEVSDGQRDGTVDPHLLKERIAEIRNMPRQETRLGRLISSLIEDNELGQIIMQKYTDRASFANVAIRYVSKFHDSFGDSTWQRYADHIVDWLYRECYPKQRGILLHELAVELGQYPAFSEAIEKKLEQSYAQPVLHAKKLIRLQLSHPEQRMGRVFAETSNTLPYVEKFFDEEEV